MLDAARLVHLEDELVAWGVLERAEGLQPTRRFRAALARAAASLQAEGGGAAPATGAEAILRVASLALERFALPPGAAVRPEHARFVAGVQVAALPPAIRAALGV